MANRTTTRSLSLEREGRLFFAHGTTTRFRKLEILMASVSADGLLSMRKDTVDLVADVDRKLRLAIEGATVEAKGEIDVTHASNVWAQRNMAQSHVPELARIVSEGFHDPHVAVLATRLEGGILDLAGHHRGFDVRTYNALASHPSALRNLVQALDRHPWLTDGMSIGSLSRKFVAADKKDYDLAGRGGDDAARLFLANGDWRDARGAGQAPPEVAGWPVSRSVVRRLAGLPADARAVHSGHVAFLSALPDSWIPEPGTEAWEVSQGLAVFAGSHVFPTFRHVPALLRGTGGDLPALRRRLGPSVRDDATYDTVASMSRIGDMLRTMRRDVLVPLRGMIGCSDKDMPDVDLAGTLLGARTLAKLADASDVWHAHERTIRLSVHPEERSGWPALTPPWRAPNGLDVVALVSSAELDAEGTTDRDAAGIPGMNHCVASRTAACAAGGVHIYSVRQPTKKGFERVSTFEAEIDRGSPVVVEHRARGNAKPPPEAEYAVGVWKAAVATGVLTMDPEALEWVPTVPLRERTVDERLKAALPAWAPLMRGRYRGLDAVELALAVMEPTPI